MCVCVCVCVCVCACVRASNSDLSNRSMRGAAGNVLRKAGHTTAVPLPNVHTLNSPMSQVMLSIV